LYAPALHHGRELWDYQSSFRDRSRADTALVCCSYDLRVCDYACQLLHEGAVRRMVLTGGTGNWTRHLWDVPEAQVFRDRAVANGISPGRILVEDHATNFGENIGFVRQLLPNLRQATIITKPNSVLRVCLTVPVQWPELTAYVDAPDLNFPDDVSNMIGVWGLLNEMVGDIDRILRYPARGFQIPHPVPQEILDSFDALISAGFSHHLLRD